VNIELPVPADVESRTKSIKIAMALEQVFTDYRLHGGPKKAAVSASYLAYLQDLLGSFRRKYSDRLTCAVGLEQIESLLGEQKKAGLRRMETFVISLRHKFVWSTDIGPSLAANAIRCFCVGDTITSWKLAKL
jgi:hypothetical protein